MSTPPNSWVARALSPVETNFGFGPRLCAVFGAEADDGAFIIRGTRFVGVMLMGRCVGCCLFVCCGKAAGRRQRTQGQPAPNHASARRAPRSPLQKHCTRLLVCCLVCPSLHTRAGGRAGGRAGIKHVPQTSGRTVMPHSCRIRARGWGGCLLPTPGPCPHRLQRGRAHTHTRTHAHKNRC